MSRSRHLGVVMDAIEGIQPKKDSTLAMLLAAQRKGWTLTYFRQRIWPCATAPPSATDGGSR